MVRPTDESCCGTPHVCFAYPSNDSSDWLKLLSHLFNERETRRHQQIQRPGVDMRSVVCLALMLGLLSSVFTFAQAPANLEARRKALNDLLKEQWEYSMRTSPIYASVLGDKRYNDQLGDYSQKAIEEDLVQTKNFLNRFEAIDTTGFPEQEALNKRLMV